MNVRGIYKTSLIDYPGKICTVLFAGGCNLKCRYCHNPDIVLNRDDLEKISNDEIFVFLKKRSSLIDGVTISGGEPTLSHDLINFIERIKKLSLDVKLDSNGLKPRIIKSLAQNRIIDYAAIDIKTSPSKYFSLTRTSIDFSKIIETVSILKEYKIEYEIRTTCIPYYVTIDDFKDIKKALNRVKRYYLQQFSSSVPLLDRSLENTEPYPVEVLLEFSEFVKSFSDICEVRGI